MYKVIYLLETLQWLPVSYRKKKSKLPSLVYKALHNLTSTYLYFYPSHPPPLPVAPHPSLRLVQDLMGMLLPPHTWHSLCCRTLRSLLFLEKLYLTTHLSPMPVFRRVFLILCLVSPPLHLYTAYNNILPSQLLCFSSFCLPCMGLMRSLNH